MDEMQYRGAPNVPLIKRETVAPQDQAHYSTLKAIHDSFAESLEALYRDFNAFTMLESATTVERMEDLMVQIKANQKAYDILSPLYQTLQQALEKIDSDFKAAQERAAREKNF